MPDSIGHSGRSAVKRVTITGIGVIAPGDPGRDAFWSLITSGGSGLRRISRLAPSPFRSQIAGECDIEDDVVTLHGNGDGDGTSTVDRSIRLAVAATDEAFTDAFNGEPDTGSIADRLTRLPINGKVYRKTLLAHLPAVRSASSTEADVVNITSLLGK